MYVYTRYIVSRFLMYIMSVIYSILLPESFFFTEKYVLNNQYYTI